MKVSRAWLQKYFDKELPDTEALADALTFHAAEVEEVAGDTMDVKVLPDRAAYLLSHRGVARELSAALDISLARDPLAEPLVPFPATDRVRVTLDAAGDTKRYMGALVTGVTVGPSPDWLRAALESVGQRSINNVVDATNYVMLAIGQPLHAFDAGKLADRDGAYAIAVRPAAADELITTLSGEEYRLPEGTLVIADAHADGAALAIAGVKGGMRASVDEATTDLVLEAANFDGTRVRRTAHALRLFTDASSRFQNKPAPELAAYGMRDLIALVLEVAGGTLAGVTDAYPAPEAPQILRVTCAQGRGILGAPITDADMQDALRRLGFAYEMNEAKEYIVRVPFERRDLHIPEDLVEEIGRIYGLDRIEAVALPPMQGVPDQARFRGIEAIRDFLVTHGFTEISTSAFAADGDIRLANPLQEDRGYLRTTLIENLRASLERARGVAARVLGPDAFIKLFEIGTVFSRDGESLMLAMGVAPHTGKVSLADEALRQAVLALESELLQIPSRARYSLDGTMMELTIGTLNLEKLGADYAPQLVQQGSYRPFSSYPSALRDIAVWVPQGTQESEVVQAVAAAAGESLARLDRFDRFEKDGRVSYAFRLVFESPERTLADTDLDPAMARVTDALNAREGWQVR